MSKGKVQIKRKREKEKEREKGIRSQKEGGEKERKRPLLVKRMEKPLTS